MSSQVVCERLDIRCSTRDVCARNHINLHLSRQLMPFLVSHLTRPPTEPSGVLTEMRPWPQESDPTWIRSRNVMGQSGPIGLQKVMALSVQVGVHVGTLAS
jgi:hypothetical protein